MEFGKRPCLFEALERVFPVFFEGRSPGAWRDLDAAVILSSTGDEIERSGVPRLVLLGWIGSESKRPVTTVAFTAARELDSRLRKRMHYEEAAGDFPLLDDGEGGTTLAFVDGRPVWRIRPGDSHVEVAAGAPPELGEGESLRGLMGYRHFFSLLPLVHFLRRITGYQSWTRPPVHAAFLLDDPNLHWPSYGYVRYRQLACHARTHGYHVAMATIPLDMWFTHPGAARIFRECAAELSLTAHGNDHLYHEFGLPLRMEQAVRMFLQASSRLDRFEVRSGISVSRVMVPPHGDCAYELLQPMLLAGFDAYCNGGQWWRDWPRSRRSIAGWHPTTASEHGLPVISRHEFKHRSARDEATIDAFLDKPLVLYGHHNDAAGGYDVLAGLADWVRSFGEVRWGSLSSLAQSPVLTRKESDGCLRVKTYARRFTVDVPIDVQRLLLELPVGSHGTNLFCNDTEYRLESTDAPYGSADVRVVGGQRARFHLVSHVSETDARQPKLSHPRAYVRRGVGETRDRIYPLVRRVHLNHALRRMELAYDGLMSKRVKRRT